MHIHTYVVLAGQEDSVPISESASLVRVAAQCLPYRMIHRIIHSIIYGVNDEGDGTYPQHGGSPLS